MSPKDSRPDVNQEQPLLDFPDGDGDPSCPECSGRGVIQVLTDVGGGVKWPGATQICKCVYACDLKTNVQRIWPVLMNVVSVKKSPLLKRTARSLWITASGHDIRRHLRYVAFRKDPSWRARVFSDSALITAWLSTVKDVYDADVSMDRQRSEGTPSNEFFTIVDLAVPYDLLIILLGVKAAKNKEMPNVLMEAVNEREIAGKPTWVVDSPIKPLQPGHICFNEEVMEVLDGFERVVLSKGTATVVHGHRQLDMSNPDEEDWSNDARESGMLTGSAASYVRRKPGMAPKASQQPTAAPAPSPGRPAQAVRPQPPPGPLEPSEDVADILGEDDLGVDALLADAHDPSDESLRGSGTIQDEYDPEEDINAIPSAEDLGTDVVPAFLQRTKSKAKAGAALRSKAGVGEDTE